MVVLSVRKREGRRVEEGREEEKEGEPEELGDREGGTERVKREGESERDSKTSFFNVVHNIIS